MARNKMRNEKRENEQVSIIWRLSTATEKWTILCCFFPCNWSILGKNARKWKLRMHKAKNGLAMKFECATPTHNWLTEKPSSTRPMKNENIRKKLFSLLRNIDEFIKIDRKTRRILTHNRLLKKTITKETNSVSILSFIVTALSLPLSFGRLRLIFSYRIFSVSWMWMILWWQNVIHFYHDFKFWSKFSPT